MPALKTRAGPAAALARVEKFYANQLEDPDPLSAVEMAKIEDLRGDAKWIDREASSSHPRWMARRGRLFEWFERRIGGPGALSCAQLPAPRCNRPSSSRGCHVSLLRSTDHRLFRAFIEFSHLNFGEGTWGSGFKYLEEWRPTLVFFAALSPIVSAAIHGVLAQSEYTKLADTSGEVAVRIHDQYEQFAKLPVSDDPADAGTLEPMRKTVLAFAETAINEASGWRAMLRDKNVPLA